MKLCCGIAEIDLNVLQASSKYIVKKSLLKVILIFDLEM